MDEAMIRVVITGPPSETGWMPYKVDFWWQGGRPQLVGLAKAPLLDACRRLKAYGLMDDTVVGLFDEWDYKDEWSLRTTVGYGSRHAVREDGHLGPKLVRHRPFPPPLAERAAKPRGGTQDALKLDAGIPTAPEPETPPSAAPPAIPAAPPPQPHTPPAQPVAKHPGGWPKGWLKQARIAKSRPKPKAGGSGGRRGSR